MARLLHRIHPAYRTSRRDYWLFGAGYCVSLLILFAIAILAGEAPGPFPTGVTIVLSLLLTATLMCVTIRRLRDAAVSVWWVLLFFFPIGLDWDLLHITLHVPAIENLTRASLSFDLVDIRSLIVFIPILLGLTKPTAPIERQMI
jgi:uncharacterized membrane protein YhaH (DUF805 family)